MVLQKKLWLRLHQDLGQDILEIQNLEHRWSLEREYNPHHHQHQHPPPSYLAPPPPPREYQPHTCHAPPVEYVTHAYPVPSHASGGVDMNVANSGQASVPGPPGVHNPRTMVNSQDSYAQPVAIAATHGVVDVYQAYGGAANGQTLHVQVTYAENYVLLKSLNVDLKEVSPSSLLMDKVREVEGNPDFSNKMSGQLNNHQWLEKLKKQSIILLISD
ncbi:hypothetical protein Lser_V15G06645 [Lactuca serriola]